MYNIHIRIYNRISNGGIKMISDKIKIIEDMLYRLSHWIRPEEDKANSWAISTLKEQKKENGRITDQWKRANITIADYMQALDELQAKLHVEEGINKAKENYWQEVQELRIKLAESEAAYKECFKQRKYLEDKQ